MTDPHWPIAPHVLNRPLTLKQRLVAALYQRLEKASTDPSAWTGGNIVRAEVTLDRPMAFLPWLAKQSVAHKVYWQGRDRQFEVAGVGCADVLQTVGPPDVPFIFRQMRSRLNREAGETRYYGGLRFDPLNFHTTDTTWQDFGGCLFILPKFELFATSSSAYLACNVRLQPGQQFDAVLNNVERELNALQFTDSGQFLHSTVKPIGRSDFPSKADWTHHIEQALAVFSSSEVDKIVLARKAVFESRESVDGLSIFAELVRRNHHCFNFFLQPNRHTAFLGSTPERLYRRQGRLVFSEAVAGTRVRGATPETDRQLEHDLLGSDKDRREQQAVSDFLQQKLDPLCHTLDSDRRVSVLKLNQLQHLMSRFEGVLAKNISDEHLIDAIHPTPAVGGVPTEQAKDWINELERFDRGFYAGPIGWVGHEKAEFAVGIRSGLVQDNRLSLFSGAGIVRGSDPHSEWEEIENKIGNFRNILKF